MASKKTYLDKNSIYKSLNKESIGTPNITEE